MEQGAGSGDIRRWEAAKLVAEFCQRQELFRDWPGRTLFAYCFFHLVQGCCFTTRARGRIRGVMFAWGMPAEEIVSRYRNGRALFEWRTSEDQADGIFVADVCCERGAGSGEPKRLRHLMLQATRRWPDWEGKRILTFRGKELHQIGAGVVKRLIAEG